MGFEPQQPRSTLEILNNFTDRMVQRLEEAKVALTKAKDKYADNLHTTQTPECSKGKYNAKIKKQKSLPRSHQQPT
jgi:hypothetical protein